MMATTPELTNRPAESGGIFRAVLLAIFLIPITVFFGLWAMFFAVIRLDDVVTWGLTIWAWIIVFVSGIKVDVQRHAEVLNARPCVFLCNHQSALDIPILFVACRGTHAIRFMAKESLFKIPFLGWGMSLSGFIPIRRESAKHSAELFKKLLSSKSGVKHSFIIFPEGTRSPDGRMQPLKRGTLGLAVRLGLPIVPVSIVDACRANPKGTLRIRPGTVRTIFHEPILIKDGEAEREQRDELLDQVTNAIASALPEEQKEQKMEPPMNADKRE